MTKVIKNSMTERTRILIMEHAYALITAKIVRKEIWQELAGDSNTRTTDDGVAEIPSIYSCIDKRIRQDTFAISGQVPHGTCRVRIV